MAMRPDITYTPCATSSREQTGNKITLAQFEEGNIITKTRNDAESRDESDDDSIMPPLLSKEEMDTMDLVDELDHDLIYTNMLERIREKVSLIRTLIKDNIFIKCVIVFGKDNRNGKER